MMMMKGRPRPGGPKEPLGAPGTVPPVDPYAEGNKTIQPFMPGQQGLLADQLNAGFGGGVPQWTGILGQYTSPMKLPNFKYGVGGGNNGNGGKPGQPDLTREQMAVAKTWIPMNGAFRTIDQQMQFQQLDPKVQEWVRTQWGGGK